MYSCSTVPHSGITSVVSTQDAEYFFQLDSALSRSRQLSTSNNGSGGCGHVKEAAAAAALGRVKQVVWKFPPARNISDFLVETYTTNTSLLHEVQDAVAVALEDMLLCL